MDLNLNGILARITGTGAELSVSAQPLADDASVKLEGFLRALAAVRPAPPEQGAVPEPQSGNPLPQSGTELPVDAELTEAGMELPVDAALPEPTASLSLDAKMPVSRTETAASIPVPTPVDSELNACPEARAVGFVIERQRTEPVKLARAIESPTTALPPAQRMRTPAARPVPAMSTEPQADAGIRLPVTREPVATGQHMGERSATAPAADQSVAALTERAGAKSPAGQVNIGVPVAEPPERVRPTAGEFTVAGTDATRNTEERAPLLVDKNLQRAVSASAPVSDADYPVTPESRLAVAVAGSAESRPASASAERTVHATADTLRTELRRVDTVDDSRFDLLQAGTAATAKTTVDAPALAERVVLPPSGAWNSASAQLQRSGSAAPVDMANGTVFDIDTPITSRDWGDALGVRVAMLMGRNIGSAELRLSPADLGPLQVQISVDDNVARVVFNSAHPLTREQLEIAMPRLREMLAEQGMTLADASVSEHSHKQGDGSAHTQPGRLAGERRPADEPAVTATSPSIAGRRLTTDLVNTYA